MSAPQIALPPPESRRWVPLRKKPLAVRFWALVEKRGPNECWPWRGGIDHDGYGHISEGDRMARAHRVSLELAVGALPPGSVVMHSCDNRWCVNPNHLAAGTIADNNADMRAKGRQARGNGVKNAKLTAPEVIAIRARYAAGETALALAEEYGVSDRLVGLVAQGKKWTHVGGPISPRRKGRAP